MSCIVVHTPIYTYMITRRHCMQRAFPTPSIIVARRRCTRKVYAFGHINWHE